ERRGGDGGILDDGDGRLERLHLGKFGAELAYLVGFQRGEEHGTARDDPGHARRDQRVIAHVQRQGVKKGVEILDRLGIRILLEQRAPIYLAEVLQLANPLSSTLAFIVKLRTPKF